MDGLLNGLHDFTVAYLDDIIIHSDTWENHLNHMEIVRQAKRSWVKSKREEIFFRKWQLYISGTRSWEWLGTAYGM